MSTSLLEVIEAGGYDLEKVEDARWLVAQEDNFAEALKKAEETIEEYEDRPCEHEDTEIETVENTDEYEYNQGIGNTSFPLTETKVEYCNNCGSQRTLPEGDWS